MTSLQPIAEDLWLLNYPMGLAGMQIGRNVTVIRLRDGRLVIHSTAPFAPEDIAAIKALGQPAWLVDATLFHDSFAKEGRRAFDGLPYLAPPGFPKVSGIATEVLDPPPEAWAGEIEVLLLEGMKANEHVFFHCASRTLIVCDLFFNFGPNVSGWTRWSARQLMRLPDGMGMSVLFRLLIRDRAAFGRSLRRMMEWDFERLIVGHGEVIPSDAKRVVARLSGRAGFDVG